MVLLSNSTCCSTKIEFLFVEILGNSTRKLLLGGVYRPPGITFDDFESVITGTVNNYYDKIIFGDLNANLCGSSPDTIYLKRMFSTLSLNLVDDLHTHHCAYTSSSSDLCLVDDILNSSDLRQFAVPFLSRLDLVGIFYSFPFSKLALRRITKRCWDRLNIGTIEDAFSAVDWYEISCNTLTDKVVHTLNAFLIQLFDFNAPPVNSLFVNL